MNNKLLQLMPEGIYRVELYGEVLWLNKTKDQIRLQKVGEDDGCKLLLTGYANVLASYHLKPITLTTMLSSENITIAYNIETVEEYNLVRDFRNVIRDEFERVQSFQESTKLRKYVVEIDKALSKWERTQTK